MADSSNSGEQRGTLPAPLVLECDFSGNNLRMSPAARLALGEPANLQEAVFAISRRTDRLNFTGMLESGGRIWLGAQAGSAPEQPKAGLARVQTNLMRHYFRLKEIENRLSAQTRRTRGSGGTAAIRQIERERSRLGRELHTGVGQMLAAIRLQLDAIETALPDPPQAVSNSLGRISTLSQEALEEVRALSRRLHPPEWQRLPLHTAIEQLWELSGIPQGFEASLALGEMPAEVPIELKVLAYRTAQEAFSNVIRHSGAHKVEAFLGVRGARLIFTVRDDGVGFDAARLTAAAPHIESGIGLRSILEQAQALAGTFSIQTGAGGTTLELSAPLTGPS